MDENDVTVFHFRLPTELHEKMEKIAARTTPEGEKINLSLIYREAVRQFLESYGAL